MTGNKGSYVLGEAASGATDEVTNWITRRMSNSFDAVVTMAGADVVVHRSSHRHRQDARRPLPGLRPGRFSWLALSRKELAMAWIDLRPLHLVSTALTCVACWLAALALTLLSSCSMISGRSSPLPTSGPTMDEIYRKPQRAGRCQRFGRRHGAGSLAAARRDRIRPGTLRKTSRQIDRRFVRVQNPDLVMAVFPHLAKGKYPIPGYQTIFPM